jgi:hypothetical protein
MQPLFGICLGSQGRDGRGRVAKAGKLNAEQITAEIDIRFQVNVPFGSLLNQFPTPGSQELTRFEKIEMGEPIAER